jgi:hypothetical protein
VAAHTILASILLDNDGGCGGGGGRALHPRSSRWIGSTVARTCPAPSYQRMSYGKMKAGLCRRNRQAHDGDVLPASFPKGSKIVVGGPKVLKWHSSGGLTPELGFKDHHEALP